MFFWGSHSEARNRVGTEFEILTPCQSSKEDGFQKNNGRRFNGSKVAACMACHLENLFFYSC